MTTKKKHMLATLVKDARTAKGYTQKELSEHTRISVRSIQRIENGELAPRPYTVRILADFLGFSPEELESTREEPRSYQLNLAQRIIWSVGSVVFILALAFAFIAQSPTFPETTFEGLLFFSAVVLIVTAALTVIWRKRA